MYLLEGVPAPDHATIARFISLHFCCLCKALLAQMSDLLYLLGEISGKTIFSGTRIESAANRSIHLYGKVLQRVGPVIQNCLLLWLNAKSSTELRRYTISGYPYTH